MTMTTRDREKTARLTTDDPAQDVSWFHQWIDTLTGVDWGRFFDESVGSSTTSKTLKETDYLIDEFEGLCRSHDRFGSSELGPHSYDANSDVAVYPNWADF